MAVPSITRVRVRRTSIATARSLPMRVDLTASPETSTVAEPYILVLRLRRTDSTGARSLRIPTYAAIQAAAGRFRDTERRRAGGCNSQVVSSQTIRAQTKSATAAELSIFWAIWICPAEITYSTETPPVSTAGRFITLGQVLQTISAAPRSPPIRLSTVRLLPVAGPSISTPHVRASFNHASFSRTVPRATTMVVAGRFLEIELRWVV